MVENLWPHDPQALFSVNIVIDSRVAQCEMVALWAMNTWVHSYNVSHTAESESFFTLGILLRTPYSILLCKFQGGEIQIEYCYSLINVDILKYVKELLSIILTENLFCAKWWMTFIILSQYSCVVSDISSQYSSEDRIHTNNIPLSPRPTKGGCRNQAKEFTDSVTTGTLLSGLKWWSLVCCLYCFVSLYTAKVGSW